MNKLPEYISAIRLKKKIGLMTHVVVGFPTLKDTRYLLSEMEKSGADIIEVQFPFSDPIADGPTIQRANTIAIENGITTDRCFEFLREVTSKMKIPILIMGYYHIVFRMGVDTFCRQAKKAGACGVIIPDFPPDEEEYDHFLQACKKSDLVHVCVLSPAITEERLQLYKKLDDEFVYVTTRNGITGTREKLEPTFSSFLEKVRSYIHVPIAVGFGISKPSHIQALIGHADIAVVGSALIEEIEKHGIQSVNGFILDLMKNTKRKEGDL